MSDKIVKRFDREVSMGEVLSYGLEDKVFVVTGGSRGIGLTIARLLLDQGAKVVICGRKEEGLSSATHVPRCRRTPAGDTGSCRQGKRCR